MSSIAESFVYFIIFCNCSKCIFLVDYPGTLFNSTKCSFIEDLLLLDLGRYASRHHSCMRPLFCFPICLYSSSVFLHWCWCFSSWLTMEELKSQSNVKCCAESTVIRYIFNYIIQKNSVCS
jgi:hypothetical protein